MNVSGIRPYDGFYQYNSIKLNELRGQQITSAHQEEAVPAVPTIDQIQEQDQDLSAAAAANQTFDSYDFAQQYQPDETFELKGLDSDLSSLDTAKAVSDLDKDQILQQYQYFVGTGSNVVTKSGEAASAMLHSGENFIL